MGKFNFKALLPHIIVISAFLVITWIYFNPLLQGKQIKQADMMNSAGMAKEIQEYRKTHSDEPLWTNSMFGGMPAYQIAISYSSNLIKPITTFFGKIATSSGSIIFLCFLGFYILLLTLRVNPYLSAIGALAFGFSSYFFIIIEAGHVTKGFAIAYMAPVIAGILLTYRGKYLTGAALTALALALELSANHLQITYYLLLMVLTLVIIKAVEAFKNKQVPSFVKASAILIGASLMAIGPNITNIWATYEYGNYTTRGKSELTNNKTQQTSGLDKDYATQWSYGVGETFTLMIPNFKGGGSGAIGKQNKAALKEVDPQLRENIGGMDAYWGEQPFTSGPTYAGALICFLFVLGIFVVNNSLKWWLLAVTVLSMTLSWGKNFYGLTEWFLDNFPAYNKFRAVSMILVLAEFTIPLLAVLALKKIVEEPELIKSKKKAFYISLGLTAGLCLIFYILPDMVSDFFKEGEYDSIVGQLKQSNAQPEQISTFMNGLLLARKAMFQADVLRSLLFILLGAGAIYIYAVKKFNPNFLYAVIGLLIIVDMASVDSRYLNKESYVPKRMMEQPFEPSQADLFILQDKSLDYRVLNMAVNTFNDASTSYFHKSIGGYHGAKLKRYKELIDSQLDTNIQNIIKTLNSRPVASSIDSTLAKQYALNMLNTKYIIYNKDAAPLINKNAYGNAWFVKEYKIVDNADAEIALVGKINPKETAIVDKRFEAQLQGFKIAPDTAATINLLSYQPNFLTYKIKSVSEQLAVFSEIYYDKGWNAYIDGKLVPHFRSDFVLRAMRIPTGEHTVEFKFEPSVYKTGERIALISSLLLIGLVLGAFFKEWKA